MRIDSFFLVAAVTAGCGGGDGDNNASANPPGSSAPPPPVVATQSPGGIWHGFPAANENLTFYIAETGELIVQGSSFVTTPPDLTFGTGAVIVNNPNDVSGTYRLRALPVAPTGPAAERTCEMDGTVTERSLLEVVIRCTDTAGNATERSVNLLYNPAYDTDSSLAEIGGNYTVPFRPLTNTLNINAGVVFGMLDNGPRCTVNGQVQIIDARFNLYRFELLLSLCQGLLPQVYEGMTLRGFGARNLPGMRPGAFLLLLSGTVVGTPPITIIAPPPDFFSMLYEPV